MSVDPCSVCGGTELNLVDGYYYCVECGTQDENVRETVVEHTVLADGTFAHAATRKFTTVLKDGIEMSGEWHKWHAFNFILVGLADELMELGAPATFKKRVLWIWARYIKKFQVKDSIGMTSLQDMEEKDMEKTSENGDSNSENGDRVNGKGRKQKAEKLCKDIKFVTKGLLLAILYIALNLDRSDIQLSHISRFTNEGRLSILNCTKFIPKELKTKDIPHWKRFIRCNLKCTPNFIRSIAMSVFKKLDLGTPLVPDLRKLIDNYITELCLPKEFKSLVFSLIHLLPCDFLEVDRSTQKTLVRIPDFEAVAMSYILIGLKMCFSLDDDYEVKLSDAVEEINNKHGYMKSYKLGRYSDQTDRLFSFREWCNFLQFRKTVLAKYYLPVAEKHNLDVDDHVFMAHLDEERSKRKIELSDEVTMDILNKIPLDDTAGVIAKSEFPATLTPMATYTEVVLQYIQDHDQRLLLSEDFTQYSLKYACKDLQLPFEVGFPITGVTQSNKTINPEVVGTLFCKKFDSKMVYIRNCENKNWLKTNPPNMESVNDDDEEEVTIIVDKENSDKDSDHGYDSNIENTPVKNKTGRSRSINSLLEISGSVSKTEETYSDDSEATVIVDRKLEMIDEEEADINIFDDTFEDLDSDKKKEISVPHFNDSYFQNEPLENVQDSKSEIDDVASSTTENIFDLETFDREEIIKELILAACKKYRIPVPAEYKTETRKRKNSLVHYGANESEPKRRRTFNRTSKGEAKKDIDRMLSAYYANLEKELLADVSEHVKSVVNDTLKLDGTGNPIGNETLVNFDANGSTIENSDSLEHDRTNVSENVDTDKITEASLLESNGDEEIDINDLIPKGDPKFDAKTHDIAQLYVKFNSEINLEDLIDFDDMELNKIIDNKIVELQENIPTTLGAKDTKKVDEYDSEDDIPLSVLKLEKNLLKDRKKQRNLKLLPLISKREHLTKFKYWFRHYSSPSMRKTLDMYQKFDLELKANCPKSFNFVLYECASILDCTAYTLYKWMQNLEELLLSRYH